MTKFEMPKWISPPQLGTLKCVYVGKGDVDWQRAVQFEVGGRRYMSLVPAESVDPDRKTLSVSIIGSLTDGSYLVDLPAETFTSGPRLQIQKDAPELNYAPQ